MAEAHRFQQAVGVPIRRVGMIAAFLLHSLQVLQPLSCAMMLDCSAKMSMQSILAWQCGGQRMIVTYPQSSMCDTHHIPLIVGMWPCTRTQCNVMLRRMCSSRVFRRLEERQVSAKDPADKSAMRKLARRLKTVHDELAEYSELLQW